MKLIEKLRSYNPRSGYSRVMREAADRIESQERIIYLVDCRTCKYYGVDVCQHLLQCLNANRYEQILPIQMWKTK